MAKKLDEPLIGTTLRLSETVIDKLDEYRRRLQSDHPGLKLTISDAARVALLKAFALEEGK